MWCIIWLKFDNREMSILLQTTTSSICNAKQKANYKLFDQNMLLLYIKICQRSYKVKYNFVLMNFWVNSFSNYLKMRWK